MAGVGVADIKGNVHHAPFRFAEQSLGLMHPQFEEVVRGGLTHSILEQAMKVKFAQSRQRRQLFQAEILGIYAPSSNPLFVGACSLAVTDCRCAAL